MDKRYLEALSNVAYSMQLLVDTLQAQMDGIESEAKFQENLTKEWNNLNSALLSIQEDLVKTKESVVQVNNKQDKILEMLKSQKERQEGMNIFGEKADPSYKKNLKDGITTIVLMAGSIMALGLAFKVVGQVDFASVLALSISLPLIAHAIAKMAETELDPKNMFYIGMTIIGMSVAIVASSWILSHAVKLEENQLLSIIAISATFAIIGWSFNNMVKGIKDITAKDLIFIPVMLVGISLAIAASSYILQYTTPITDKVIDIIAAAFTIAVATTIMAVPVWLLSKMFKNPMAILLGGVAALGIAAVIAGASQILTFGDYTKYPSLDWAMGVGLSLLGFGVASVALGTIILGTGGLGAGAIAAGLGAVLVITAALVEADKILAENSGGWASYPSLEWAKGVGGALGAFAPIFKRMIQSQALSIITGSGFSGDDFANTIVSISKAMVKSSHVFTEGNWAAGYPSQEWAKNVAFAISEFNKVYKDMDSGGIMGFFGANDSEEIQEMVVAMAMTMVKANQLFSGQTWNKYPSKQWVNNISYAIAKFTENWKMLSDTGDVDDMEEATTTVIKMARAYNKLADSIEKLGEALKDLDKDGVKQIKHVTEHVLAMSVVDEDKLEDLLEIISDNSSGLGRFAASLTQKISTFTSAMTKTSKQVPTDVETPELLLESIKGEKDKSIGDLWDQLEELKGIIAIILENSTSISGNVEEIANKEDNIGLQIR